MRMRLTRWQKFIGYVAIALIGSTNGAAQEATQPVRQRHQLVPHSDNTLLVIGGSTLVHGMAVEDERYFVMSAFGDGECLVLEGPIESMGYPGRAPSFINYRGTVMVAGGFDRVSRQLLNRGVQQLTPGHRWVPVVDIGPFGNAGNPLLFEWADQLMLIVRPSLRPESDDPRSIWLSEDVVSWRRVGELPEAAIQRGGYELVVFGDRLVLRSQGTGIWVTEDLEQWRRVEVNMDLVWQTAGSSTAVVHQGRLYVIGGRHPGTTSGNVDMSTTFVTDDLERWEFLSGHTPGREPYERVGRVNTFPPRISPALYSDGERMIMHGGRREDSNRQGVLSDFWVSEDGIRWRELAVCADDDR